jgi:hypothetical protein
MSHVFVRVEKLVEKGVGVHLVNHGLVLKKEGLKKKEVFDISSLYLVALSLGADLARSLISGTIAGLENAKENGKILGRPRGVTKLDDYFDQIIDYKARGFNFVIIASELYREHKIIR